jgi:Secretion system C-terminal sorting domain
MKSKTTLPARLCACAVLTLGSILTQGLTATTCAQLSCTNESVLFTENFGAGTTPTSSPDVLPIGLTYQPGGVLSQEGVYRIINNTRQKTEWQSSEDHTANDVNGKMLVANGQAETYYSHQVNMNLVPGVYIASLFIMNVDTPGTCAPNPLLPVISFRVEYLSQANTWLPLTGSPYTAAPVVQTATPTWVHLGSAFTLPATGTFLVKSIRIILTDGTHGGCGNDFAMDDVKFSLCPEGGPLPVQFINISARQKGSGISVEWSTAQEINSSSFVVEKSANGNSGWSDVATITAAGNSSVVKNYNAFDPRPFKGNNFYRIRQVDKDGNFTYTKTVNVSWNLNTTGITVITNPFRNTLTIDISSPADQMISARLVDITGKQVALEKWSLASGTSRKEISKSASLQHGIYILSVTNAGGEILYNNKVVKE